MLSEKRAMIHPIWFYLHEVYKQAKLSYENSQGKEHSEKRVDICVGICVHVSI